MINAVDKFVFYDDVNFIKRGWINRNNLLSNGKEALISIPLKKASQNKLINEIETSITEKYRKKLLSTIEFNYRKAPYYSQIVEIIRQVVRCETSKISDFSAKSVVSVCDYLGIGTEFHFSSKLSSDSKGMDRADRLIYIAKDQYATQYINTIGGKELYNKTYFEEHGIDLKFIEPKPFEYEQFGSDFVPWLSIIDVLMFNSKEDVLILLNKYKLL